MRHELRETSAQSARDGGGSAGLAGGGGDASPYKIEAVMAAFEENIKDAARVAGN
jgi:hypothetical protein